MRFLVLFFVVVIAGCHAAPIPCDAHLTPINRPVAAVNAAAGPAGSAPGLKGAP